MKNITREKIASISVAHVTPHALHHSLTPCFIICLVGIRGVHSLAAKATTAGGTQRWRRIDSQEVKRKERGKYR